MVILPLPLPKPNPCSSSISLQPNNNPCPMHTLVSVGAGKHYIAATFTLNATYQTKNPVLFFNNNNNSVDVQESSSRAGKLVADQTLTTSRSDQLKTKEKEVEAVICRLKTVVERIRESEVDKLMGRLKGTMSEQDMRLLVENTSREIVVKLLERPVSYLKGVNGDFEEKVKDINLLILMLEKSSVGCQR